MASLSRVFRILLGRSTINPTNSLLNTSSCASFGLPFFPRQPRVISVDLFAGLDLRNLVTCHSPHRRLIRPLSPLPPSASLSPVSLSLSVSAFAARNHTTKLSFDALADALSTLFASSLYAIIEIISLALVTSFCLSSFSLVPLATTIAPCPRSCLVATREIL